MSSFRSGIYIGFALAATATGIYQCMFPVFVFLHRLEYIYR
ncbi:hypothetical protein ID866_2089 [Astraeus odoratus]|nr:hypothetical protein ID866_2089 [Astraeus odoratus]